MVLMVSVVATGTFCVASQIPPVHGTSLTNQPVTLPEGLHGKPGVLILGFSRGSRDAVAGWGRRLAADYRNSSDVMYYEMPVLASVPDVIRGFVVRSMKSSPPQQAQARLVPITDHEAAWRALAHYGPADDPYVMLIDGSGTVIWQTHGQSTDAAYAVLKQQIESLTTQSARESQLRR